jgi:ADP-dependent NAD(P)H-hydrate dehydratase / NAD(P)H-hydrate epimerase
MKVATTEEIQRIDRMTIEHVGIPGSTLMECAGILALKTILKRFDSRGRSFLILCGTGNNGGDGLVMARHLHLLGGRCSTIIAGRAEKITGDALLNYKALRNISAPSVEIADESGLDALEESLARADIIVDALFGTGLSSPLRAFPAAVIALINKSGKIIVSVDIPSGIDATTGHVMGCAVKAHLTVTMGLPKMGLLLYPGASHTGEIIVAHIGFPRHLLEDEQIRSSLAFPEELAPRIPGRPPDAHKGTCGRALIVGGSKGYTGAAALSSMSCHRAGAGLVTLAIPESLNPIMEEKLTETITHPYPDPENEKDIAKALKEILGLCAGADALALGPGIGREPSMQELAREIVRRAALPAVLDADALFPSIVEGHRLELPILTPHPGEMGRLMEKETREIMARPVDYCRECARKYRAVVILKGSHSLIADPSGRLSVNITGNPGMATAGMGDVLTGIIAGLLAQGTQPYDAALCGAFIHGLAGDYAARTMGGRGLLASDLISLIPMVLELITEKRFEEIRKLMPLREATLFE